jgi:hypothetical protein
VYLLTKFGGVNLGMSVECFHPVNDYIRYGSNIDTVRKLIDKWQKVAQENSWYTQLRITPTVFSVGLLVDVYEYAYQNGMAVESCNFLVDPDFMRPSVLPTKLRMEAMNKLTAWIQSKNQPSGERIINTRNPAFSKQQLIEDAMSYVNYLHQQPYQTELLPKLVEHIKLLESNRKNSILTYLPEYEELLRSVGY